MDSRLEPLHYEIFKASAHTLWLVNEQAVVCRKTELALQYGEQKWGQEFIRLKAKLPLHSDSIGEWGSAGSGREIKSAN